MVSGVLIERVLAYGSYWDFNMSGGLVRTGSLASLHSSLCANVVGSCSADSLAFLAGSPNTASLTERNSVGQAGGSSVATEGTSAGQAGGGGAAQDEQGRAPGEPEVLELAAITQQTRVISYSYDGLLRLTGADYSTGASFSYSYDLAGNRTDGGRSYNAANQVAGWSYDGAGNLVSDGATSYTYDALGRMTSRSGTSYGYNGDGALVSAGATRYAQDLAAPLSQVLSDGTTNYLYGLDRLAAQAAGTTTWYATDALGSVRQTLNNAGTPIATASYDPWGVPQGSAIAPFGFTGELQDAQGLTYLRARWYTPSSGTFTAARWRSDESWATIPYSNHPYAYALSNPVNWTDPTGKYCKLPDGSPCPQPADVALRCGQPGQPACLPPGIGPTPTPTRPNQAGEVILGLGMAAVMRPSNPYLWAAGALCVGIGAIAVGAGQVAVQTRPQTRYVVAPVPAPQPATPTPMPFPGQPPTPTPSGMSVFKPGGDTPQSTQHIIDAIAAGKPSTVTYRGPNNSHSRRWLRNAPACRGGSANQWCDEYPFASVDEGGQANNPSLRLVPGAEQSIQGGKISGFLSACRVVAGEKYKVEPNSSLAATTWTCKR